MSFQLGCAAEADRLAEDPTLTTEERCVDKATTTGRAVDMPKSEIENALRPLTRRIRAAGGRGSELGGLSLPVGEGVFGVWIALCCRGGAGVDGRGAVRQRGFYHCDNSTAEPKTGFRGGFSGFFDYPRCIAVDRSGFEPRWITLLREETDTAPDAS